MKRKRIRRIILYAVIVIVIATVAKNAFKYINKIIYPLRYEEYIEQYSNEYDIDKFLVMALIKAESNYIFDAHSGKASGLMQITESTAEWISEKTNIEYDNINDPDTNIKMGCFYLKYLIDYYNGDTNLALAAYNAGMGNVNRWLADAAYSKNGNSLDIIPFGETEKYVEKINKYTTIYKEIYD